MRSLVIVVLLGSAAHADPARCVVAGHAVTLEEITVKPPGVEPFTLAVHDVPVRAALPDRCGSPLALAIGGSLAFSASRDLVWLKLTRDVTTPDGLITIKRGASVTDACIRSGRVIASAVLATDDMLEGEHKPAEQQIDGVEIPCDALSLEAVELPDDEFLPMQKEPQTARFWKPRASDTATSIALFSAPSARAVSRRLASPAAYNTILFVERKRKGDWLFVEAAGDGVHARGWIQRRKLVREDDPNYGSFGCTGDHHSAMAGFGFSNAVEHTATVRIGTTMYFGDGTSPWAVFARDEKVTVWITPGSRWASVSAVPGLSEGILGEVAVDALTIDPTP